MLHSVTACSLPHTRSPVLQYTERDQDGSYTMLSGDIVQFNIATDKRDGSRRATSVQLHKLVECQQPHVTREKVGREGRDFECFLHSALLSILLLMLQFSWTMYMYM